MAEQALQKHTPGPWELETTWDGHAIRMGDAIADRGSYEAHNIVRYEHGCECDVEGSDAHAQYQQALANARLIAAAPELLDLMHWAITAVDRLAEVTPSGALRTGIRAKADEIRAAIAKAEAAQ